MVDEEGGKTSVFASADVGKASGFRRAQNCLAR
jgi:hypothetical protein